MSEQDATPGDTPNEEYVRHPFNSRMPRTPFELGDERDIWCKDCEYHRDHKIHSPAGDPHGE